MKATAGPRVRSLPRHRSFHLSKTKLKQHKPVPGAIALFKQSYSIISSNKRLFIGVALINALLSYVFIQGLGSSFDINEAKTGFQELIGGGFSGQLTTGLALFSYLVGSAGSGAGENAGSYQILFTLVTSLAVIWLVRQVLADEKPALRDGFYKGMYPLIPFTLVLMVIGLQLIPLIVGNLMYSTIIQNGLAVSIIEKVIWFVLFVLLGLLSAYMVVSSLFSLYIVTLPDMRPIKALRSARELVLHRRLYVGLRIIALPLSLTIVGALIFVPLLLFVTPLAQPLFLLLTSFSLVIIHIYLYLLYRALI